ncbi:MAG: VWA domain-containing protein [Acidobacteria bacterium]|nr:VWA domain-containing protein [Acidobacteriota bacterium]
MTSRTTFFLLLALHLPGIVHVVAQDKKPGDKDEIIRVDTQLVDVPIAVVDSKGMPVRGLTANNFVVYEDGKPQEIADFSTTSEPFEVALLLDTSGSTRNDLPLIQRAAADFIASLRPGDRVSIISFNTDRSGSVATAVSEVLCPLTDDRRSLALALQRVQVSNGTPYYDGLLQVAEKVYRDKPTEAYVGRRALVALTDGVDSTSAADFGSAKAELAQVGVISYFIKVDTRDFFESELMGDCNSAIHFSAAQIRRYYKSIAMKGNAERAVSFCDLGEFERLAVSKKLYEIADAEMSDLARNSGGRIFPVDDLSEARGAFKSVADDLGTKYTLGYYPTNEKRDGTYRKIKVELKGLPAGTKVTAREGYTAPGQ